MGKFGRKLAGAFKKAMGASSSRSHRSSSACYTKPEESLMHEDEEMVPMEEEEQEQEQEQEQPMGDGDDDPHLDWRETGRRKRTTSSRIVSSSTRRRTTPASSKR